MATLAQEYTRPFPLLYSTDKCFADGGEHGLDFENQLHFFSGLQVEVMRFTEIWEEILPDRDVIWSLQFNTLKTTRRERENGGGG
jgi:hypothetical protein